jgi:hypothetical protein
MADTVKPAAPSSPSDGAEEMRDAPAADGAEAAQDGRSAGVDGKAERSEENAEEPEERAEEPDEKAEEPDEKAEEAEEKAEEAEEQEEEAPSVTELFERLGRTLSQLSLTEAQLEAARNLPEVRRAARDVAGALVMVVAALTAFAFVNVAAMDGLSRVMATWLAALVLALVWLVIGGVLFLTFKRARRWLLWIVLKAPPSEAMEELEQERATAGKAARTTLERLGPALAIQIALAAVPKAGDVAEDVASGVLGVGDTVLEASDATVEVIAEQLPGRWRRQSSLGCRAQARTSRDQSCHDRSQTRQASGLSDQHARRAGARLYDLSGFSALVNSAPCAAPEPLSPPPGPRSTNATATAITPPAIGPATYTQ